jgi:hypothetical protein
MYFHSYNVYTLSLYSYSHKKTHTHTNSHVTTIHSREKQYEKEKAIAARERSFKLKTLYDNDRKIWAAELERRGLAFAMDD